MFKTPHLNPLEWLAVILLVVGGLNWGLVGLFEYDLVAQIFGEEFGTITTATRVIYVVVGIAAIYTVIGLLRMEAMTAKFQREHQHTEADRGTR